jgi:O-6-methylguanine DNA methyltransferase
VTLLNNHVFRYALLTTVLDPFLAVAGEQGLVRLEFLPRAYQYHTHAHAVARALDADSEVVEDSDHFEPLLDELSEYFTGRREVFHFPVDLHGTEFQLKVWSRLLTIPFGKLRTYGQVAREIRRPTATRAVGQAAGQNPVPILVPCHRVVGKNGSLTGFASGLKDKARLLRLEGHTLSDTATLEEPQLF